MMIMFSNVINDKDSRHKKQASTFVHKDVLDLTLEAFAVRACGRHIITSTLSHCHTFTLSHLIYCRCCSASAPFVIRFTQTLRPRNGGISVNNIINFAIKSNPEAWGVDSVAFRSGRLIKGVQKHIENGLEAGLYVPVGRRGSFRVAPLGSYQPVMYPRGRSLGSLRHVAQGQIPRYEVCRFNPFAFSPLVIT